MYKKNIMRDFIIKVSDSGMLTKFIKNIFGYKNFFDYNYMFRYIEKDNSLILDIYDNVTDSNFNRYVFEFDKCDYVYKKEFVNDLFIHYISVLNVVDSDDNLIKLAYLFKINNDKMIGYAKTFLDNEFVLILKEIMK